MEKCYTPCSSLQGDIFQSPRAVLTAHLRLTRLPEPGHVQPHVGRQLRGSVPQLRAGAPPAAVPRNRLHHPAGSVLTGELSVGLPSVCASLLDCYLCCSYIVLEITRKGVH